MAAEVAAEKALSGDPDSWQYFKDVILPLESVWEARVPRDELLAPHLPRLRKRAARYAETISGAKAWACADELNSGAAGMDLAEFTRVSRKLAGPLSQYIGAADVEDAFLSQCEGGGGLKPVALLRAMDALIARCFEGGGRAPSPSSTPGTDGGDAESRCLPRFLRLALLAYEQNLIVLKEMEKRATRHLFNDKWGRQIAALGDVCTGEDSRSQPAIETLFAAATDYLGDSPRLAPAMDARVMTAALREVSLGASEAFRQSLDAVVERHPRAEVVTSVKGTSRMEVKAAEYGAKGTAMPYTARISDPLRALIFCPDSEVMLALWDDLSSGRCESLVLTRFVNKLGRLEKPFNLHANATFKAPGVAPLTVEVQLLHSDLKELFYLSHRYYKLCRASSSRDLGDRDGGSAEEHTSQD